MRDFKDYLKVVLIHEGGYVNDKDDLGGETKFGISIQFLKAEGIDIDNDGDIDSDDIRKLTIEDSSRIYKSEFFDSMNLSLINDELLKLHLFDMGVNAGKKSAILLLQKLVNQKQDGILGRITANYVNMYKGNLVLDYVHERLDYYKRICDARPANTKFLKGWINRVNTTKFI